MTPTTPPAVRALITTAILGMQPRMTRKGAQKWKLAGEATDSPAHTRRFRLEWLPGGYTDEGLTGIASAEVEAELAIVTDYIDEWPEVTELIEDDHLQLEDMLQGLVGPSNGLIRIDSDGVDDIQLNADDQQVSHMFRVRYLRQRS
jgi:hypothetical protein